MLRAMEALVNGSWFSPIIKDTHTPPVLTHTYVSVRGRKVRELEHTHTSGFHVSARFDCVVQVAWVRVCLSLLSKLPFWIVHRERPAFVPTANSARGAFTVQLQFPLQFWQYSWQRHLKSMVNPRGVTIRVLSSVHRHFPNGSDHPYPRVVGTLEWAGHVRVIM